MGFAGSEPAAIAAAKSKTGSLFIAADKNVYSTLGSKI